MTDVHNDVLEDEDFDTILSPDIEFAGVLHTEKSFLIRGRVSGEIFAKAILVVDANAVVEANINGSRVIIRGEVKGNVIASEKMELTLTGKLTGNVTAPDISMEPGCHFNGRCLMEKNAGL
jgi:cytoskeletal protein CcmA (bactofilin family)